MIYINFRTIVVTYVVKKISTTYNNNKVVDCSSDSYNEIFIVLF